MLICLLKAFILLSCLFLKEVKAGQECDPSCATCSDLTSCDTCEDSMLYNSTSMLCEMCPQGEYFDATKDVCRTCDGVCAKDCAYQNFCFECSGDQLFDLDNFECVEECGDDQRELSGDQVHGLKFCRTLDYYVDPESTDILELGTLDHPYKSLMLPFIEILNYHSNSNATINVYVFERTDVEILLDYIYLINIEQVNLIRFSAVTDEPDMVNLVVKDQDVDFYNVKTRFNLLSNTDFNVSVQSNHADITSRERTQILTKNIGFHVVRSGFNFEGFNVVTEFTSSKASFILVKGVYMQNREIRMSDLELRGTGSIFKTIDPLNFYASNLDIDYYQMKHGFIFTIECNYTDAATTGIIDFNNITAYNSQDRTTTMDESLIRIGAMHNISITNSNLNIYGTTSQNYPPIFLETLSKCNPNDSVPVTISIFSTIFHLTQSPSNDRFNQLYTNILSSSIRAISIVLNNNTFSDMAKNTVPLYEIYGSSNTSLSSVGVTILNCTLEDSAMYFSTLSQLEIRDYFVSNLTSLSGHLIRSYQVGDIQIEGLGLYQSTLEDQLDDEYFYLETIDEGTVVISNFTVSDLDVKDRKLVKLVSVRNFTFLDSSFSSITINEENSLLDFGTLSTLNMDRCTFESISPNDEDDTTPFILNIDSFDLSKGDDLIINDIKISSSSVTFTQIDSIKNTPTSSRVLTISNFEYCDSQLEFNNKLLIFRGLETSVDFSIELSNILFSNIEFSNTGYLIDFEHQTSVPLKMTNLTISGTKNGRIVLEAQNSQNTALPTYVNITNLVTSNVDVGFKTLFTLNQNTKLEIYNSLIEYIYTYEEASFLYASEINSVGIVHNSTIRHNAAIQGGVFKAESQGVVRVYDSQILNNFALISGVVKIQNNGQFEFYNCTIQANAGMSATITQMFDSTLTSVIDGCDIASNAVYDKETLDLYFTNATNCGVICWLKDDFKNFLLAHDSVYDITTSDFIIQVITSSIELTGGNAVINQAKLINAFISELYIDDLSIEDSISTGSMIEVTGTNLTVENCFFNFIDNADSASVTIIKAVLDSYVIIRNIEFYESDAQFVSFQSSNGLIDNVTSEKCDVRGMHFMSFQSVTEISISNLNFIDIGVRNSRSSFGLSHVIGFKDSNVQNITNFSIEDTGEDIIGAYSSTIDLIDTYIVDEGDMTLKLDDSSVTLLTNADIHGSGSRRSSKGNIRVENSNITITDSIFDDNYTREGGAIRYVCDSTSYCENYVYNCTFIDSRARSQGGAISYDVYRPTMENLTFENNEAPYGNDIASYPVKLIIEGTNSTKVELFDVASGQEYYETLIFNLVDYDNQITSAGSVGSVSIRATKPNTEVLGMNNQGLSEGSAVFSGLTFVGTPGAPNVEFSVSSDAIDKSILLRQFGSSSIQEPLSISFRYCKPGERIFNNKCKICDPGTYSLEWSSSKCHSCFENADCIGGTEIHIDEGYWRKSTNSTYAIECIREKACEGGYEPQNVHPVQCADGYDGMLCTECLIEDGEKFERLANYECSKCPSILFNAIRIAGLMLLVAIFFIILIVINVRKRKESQQSILLRILANYFQLITAALSFNLKFPDAVTEAFYPLERIGNSSEAFLSFDCFVEDTEIRAFAPSNAIFKILLAGLLPIVLILFSIVCWFFIGLCSKKLWSDMFRNNVVTVICIMFLMHPMLTKVGLEIFQCVEVDENKYNVRIDIDIGCFSYEHIKWALLLGLPIIIIYTIGCPLLVFIILYRNRKQLDDPKVSRYFLLLYQGLKHECFYWECVNTIRKVIMVAINVFMSTLPVVYAAIVAVLALIGLLRLQIRLQPYKNELNNKLEIEAVTTGTATLFGGVLFISDDTDLVLVILFVLLIIIIINVRYILYWMFCMCFTLVEKHELFRASFNMLAFITCRRKQANKMIMDSGIVLKDQFSINTQSVKKTDGVEERFKRKLKKRGKSKLRLKKANLRKKITNKKRGNGYRPKASATAKKVSEPIYGEINNKTNQKSMITNTLVDQTDMIIEYENEDSLFDESLHKIFMDETSTINKEFKIKHSSNNANKVMLKPQSQNEEFKVGKRNVAKNVIMDLTQNKNARPTVTNILDDVSEGKN